MVDLVRVNEPPAEGEYQRLTKDRVGDVFRYVCDCGATEGQMAGTVSGGTASPICRHCGKKHEFTLLNWED